MLNSPRLRPRALDVHIYLIILLYNEYYTPCPTPVWQEFLSSRQMNTVRKSLTEDAATTMVHAFVTSRVDYCNSVLHRASASSVQSLQNALNAAARIILRKRKFDHITTDVRDQLHWLPVQQRIEYKVCVLVHKCLHQAAPIYLAELCSPVSESANSGHLCLLGVTSQFHHVPEQ